MNATTIKRHYFKHAAARAYVVGFIRAGKVYYFRTDDKGLRKLLTETRTSSARGGVISLRVYVPADVQRKLIAEGKAVELCDAAMLDGANAGDLFEKVVFETFTGKTWKKDRTAFYEAGDMELDGEQIQIKLNTATLTNETVIKHMLKKLGE